MSIEAVSQRLNAEAHRLDVEPSGEGSVRAHVRVCLGAGAARRRERDLEPPSESRRLVVRSSIAIAPRPGICARRRLRHETPSSRGPKLQLEALNGVAAAAGVGRRRRSPHVGPVERRLSEQERSGTGLRRGPHVLSSRGRARIRLPPPLWMKLTFSHLSNCGRWNTHLKRETGDGRYRW